MKLWCNLSIRASHFSNSMAAFLKHFSGDVKTHKCTKVFGGFVIYKSFVFDHRFYESTVCYFKCLRLREEIELGGGKQTCLKIKSGLLL